jgi:hypothetical protein
VALPLVDRFFVRVWVFALYALVLGWAFYTASRSLARFVAGGTILIGIGF